MAGVEADEDRAERAARLLGAATAVLDRVGSPLPPRYQREQRQIEQQTQTSLHEAGFAAAWAAGRAMTLEQMIRDAMDSVS